MNNKTLFPIDGNNFGLPGVFYFGLGKKEEVIKVWIKRNNIKEEIDLLNPESDEKTIKFLKNNFSIISDFWLGKSNPLELFKSLKTS